MHFLTLVRHAKSSWAEVGVSDHQRSLNTRGLQDCAKVASWCLKNLPQPELWLVSSAKRTMITATILATKYGLTEAMLRVTPQLYNSRVETYASVVEQVEDRFKHIIIFAHNPTISEFASYLNNNVDITMPTLGLAHFEIGINDWSLLETVRPELLNYITPKQLPLD